MLRSYLFEAAGVLLTRVPKMVHREGLGRGSPSATGSARPKLQSRVSSRSFCIACGSMEPSSTGRRRKLLLANETTEFLPNGRKRRPCRDDGDGEFDRFCASVRKDDRDCNIEPPTSPYAIMRRVYPYRGENSGPGKDDRGELDTQTRN